MPWFPSGVSATHHEVLGGDECGPPSGACPSRRRTRRPPRPRGPRPPPARCAGPPSTRPGATSRRRSAAARDVGVHLDAVHAHERAGDRAVDVAGRPPRDAPGSPWTGRSARKKARGFARRASRARVSPAAPGRQGEARDAARQADGGSGYGARHDQAASCPSPSRRAGRDAARRRLIATAPGADPDRDRELARREAAVVVEVAAHPDGREELPRVCRRRGRREHGRGVSASGMTSTVRRSPTRTGS